MTYSQVHPLKPKLTLHPTHLKFFFIDTVQIQPETHLDCPLCQLKTQREQLQLHS